MRDADEGIQRAEPEEGVEGGCLAVEDHDVVRVAVVLSAGERI